MNFLLFGLIWCRRILAARGMKDWVGAESCVSGHRVCGISFGCACLRGMLQDHCNYQQNPNKAKYRQREQSHYEYRHSFTSLTEIVSPRGLRRCDHGHLLMWPRAHQADFSTGPLSARITPEGDLDHCAFTLKR
jgi:hypothetical protein